MRILMTGDIGFIGSRLLEACLVQGHEVAVVADTGATTGLSPLARLYPVDVGSRELDDVVAVERPEIVSHHASRGGRQGGDPIGDAQVDLLGTLSVLDVARRRGVRRIVFASPGSALYDEADGRASEETSRCRPRSAAAVARLAAEHALAAYAAGGLQTIALRHATVYGPCQHPAAEVGVVASFIARILAGRPPTIFGDGGQVRDFVYVEDVVRAHLAAHALPVGTGQSHVFNVGTGHGTSIRALWAMLARISGAATTPVHEPTRGGEPVRSVLDATWARALLGWQARVALEPGLQRTWAWCVAHAASTRAAA